MRIKVNSKTHFTGSGAEELKENRCKYHVSNGKNVGRCD